MSPCASSIGRVRPQRLTASSPFAEWVATTRYRLPTLNGYPHDIPIQGVTTLDCRVPRWCLMSLNCTRTGRAEDEFSGGVSIDSTVPSKTAAAVARYWQFVGDI